MTIRFIKIFSLLLLALFMMAGCSLFEKEKNDDSKRNLLVLAALSNRSSTGSTREMYTGFADIPTSIYKTVASGSASTSIQAETKTLATTDYKFQNSAGTSSVSGIYDLVRVTAKSTRDIAKSIGDLVKALETIPVTTTLQGTDTWGGIASKYRYQTSTILTGGKKLEVWWNNGAAPYSNNKAIEMNYTGSTASGNINGFVFVRYLSATNATTLSKAYINFNYNASTNTRTMVVILQDIGSTYTDKAHFFVQEVNGVTSMDGTYTVYNYNPNATGVAAANRAYVFSAIGNSSKAVVNAALPLATDTTTAIYANTAMGNIGQVWTNFIFANSSTVSTVQGLGGTCANPNVMLTPTSGNPTATTAVSGAVTTVANLKACLDAINPSVNAKDVYFLTNIKNPAYFSVSGNTVSLYGVESLDASDANKAAFDTLQNSTSFLTSTRTTADTTYAATLNASTVNLLDLFTGVSVPQGTSATTLTSLNAMWGNGTPGTGTSTSSAGTNTVNGSVDNTAPF